MREGYPGSDCHNQHSRDGKQNSDATLRRRCLGGLRFRVGTCFGRVEFGWIKTRGDFTDGDATGRIGAQALPREGRERLGHRLGHGWVGGFGAIPNRRVFGKDFDKCGAKRPNIRGRNNQPVFSLRSIAYGSRWPGYDGCAHGTNAVSCQLEAVARGHDIRGVETAVDETLGVQISERGQRRAEHFASLVGRERPLLENLRENFVGIFRDNVVAGNTVDFAAAVRIDLHQIRMGKGGSSFPCGGASGGILILFGD